MRVDEPITQTMTTASAGAAFGELIKKVAGGRTRVLVEEHGKPLAAIVSAEDLQRLAQLDSEWEGDWAVIDELHARNRDKDPDEVVRDVAATIVAVRDKARRQQTKPPGA